MIGYKPQRCPYGFCDGQGDIWHVFIQTLPFITCHSYVIRAWHNSFIWGCSTALILHWNKMLKCASFIWFIYIYKLLTPWSRDLLEKLTASQLLKEFPAFFGTRRFIAAFTSARHLSLSWARSIQSIPPHSTSWRSILILSSYLRLGLLSDLVRYLTEII